GRNGESPVVVIAAGTPGDCFYFAYQAAKIALERMVPVILLTDGFLGNGSEPFRIPKLAELPSITPRLAKDSATFKAYARDEEVLARDWAIPGMPGFEHRIGGLEKNVFGTVSHDPEDHERNTMFREEKVQKVVNLVPDLEVYGDEGGEVLVVGWGGTGGHLISAVKQMRKMGHDVSLAHFNYIKPLPRNTGKVFSGFKKIVICELNMGQFAGYLRDKLPGYEYHQINKMKGLPFTISEIRTGVEKLLDI